MIAVVERVSRASVTVDGRVTGRINSGLLILLGVEKGDTQSDLDYIVSKTAGLRVFEQGGKMTLSVMPFLDLPEYRRLVLAYGTFVKTPGMENTSRWQVDRAWQVSFYLGPSVLGGRVGDRNRGK